MQTKRIPWLAACALIAFGARHGGPFTVGDVE
jgi:hypothetical protein